MPLFTQRVQHRRACPLQVMYVPYFPASTCPMNTMLRCSLSSCAFVSLSSFLGLRVIVSSSAASASSLASSSSSASSSTFSVTSSTAARALRGTAVTDASGNVAEEETFSSAVVGVGEVEWLEEAEVGAGELAGARDLPASTGMEWIDCALLSSANSSQLSEAVVVEG